MPSTLRAVHSITVHCPIEAATLQAIGRGDTTALNRDPVIIPILQVIEKTPEFGDFGTYSGVCEVAVGLEAFTPGAAAAPTLGLAGQRTVSPTALLTTYVDGAVTATRLEQLVEALAAAHPWEVPVIAVGSARLRIAAKRG